MHKEIKPPTFDIREIAEWVQNDEKVSLPTVQRGFVWKPSQIENLWDSLLRGYPIGAFVLSPRKNQPEKFEMLDGQQRATAIALGFGYKTFRKETQHHYRVFIDLERPKPDDSRRFYFRVITRSHPWGYNLRDNSKPLTADEKRQAMELYRIEDHLEEDLINFFPYDASLPIPFHIFLQAAKDDQTPEELIYKIKNVWKNSKGENMWYKIKTNWTNWSKKYLTDEPDSLKRYVESYELNNDIKIGNRIKDIYKHVIEMLKTQKVPALYLDFEKIKKQEFIRLNVSSEIIENIDINDEDADEVKLEKDSIENLFIRLNAGGTVIRGEELNYSILKSHLTDPGLIDRLEEACKDFIKPARFITIAFRLYQKDIGIRDSISMNIKPKQFQNTISEAQKKKKTFEFFLNQLITEKKYCNKGKTLLGYAQFLIEYSETCTFGLPHLITCKLAEAAPEIMFMFLYRLRFVDDEPLEIDEDIHRKVLGIITILMWLGKGEKQRDHAKVLANIWPAVQSLNTRLFWTNTVIQRARINNILTAIPSFGKSNGFKKLKILVNNAQSNTPVWDRIDKNTDFYNFVHTIFYERDLIIYSQRHFLNKIFKTQEYHSDDTNMPFDWDHISASKFIKSKKGIPKIVKEWYNTNGNLRAWPYSLNRTDQAVVPSLKFDPLNPDKYDDDSLFELSNSQKQWDAFVAKNQKLINDTAQLRDKLLDWSFCENNKWMKCESDNMKYDGLQVYELIMDRNFRICKEWYDKLYIDELLKFKAGDINEVLNKIKWNKLANSRFNKKLRKELLTDDYNICWIGKEIKLTGTNTIFMFFRYSDDANDNLKDDSIELGIYSSGESFIKSIAIPEKLNYKYYIDGNNKLIGYFTLASYDQSSYIKLINDIYQWLKEFKIKTDDNRLLQEIFIQGIKSKYISQIN